MQRATCGYAEGIDMEQSRREFLGLLSWIVLTPVTQGKVPEGGAGTIYQGPLQLLAESLAARIKPEFRCYVLSLNEAVEDSMNWISNDLGSTLVEISGRNWEELSAELIARKVRRAIHVTYFDPKPGPPEAYIVELTVFETPLACALAWQSFEESSDETGFKRYGGIGEGATISSAEHTIGCRLCFLRGNVMASILSFTSEEEVPRVARLLDHQISEMSF